MWAHLWSLVILSSLLIQCFKVIKYGIVYVLVLVAFVALIAIRKLSLCDGCDASINVYFLAAIYAGVVHPKCSLCQSLWKWSNNNQFFGHGYCFSSSPFIPSPPTAIIQASSIYISRFTEDNLIWYATSALFPFVCYFLTTVRPPELTIALLLCCIAQWIVVFFAISFVASCFPWLFFSFTPTNHLSRHDCNLPSHSLCFHNALHTITDKFPIVNDYLFAQSNKIA